MTQAFPFYHEPSDLCSKPVVPLSKTELQRVITENHTSSLGKSIMGEVPAYKIQPYKRPLKKDWQKIRHWHHHIQSVVIANDLSTAIKVLFSERKMLSPVCMTRSMINNCILNLFQKLKKQNKKVCRDMLLHLSSTVSRHEGARIIGKRQTFLQALNKMLAEFKLSTI